MENWQKTKTVLLKDICDFEKGTTGLAKAVPGEYPLVATGAARRSCDSFQFDTKAVCIPLVSSTGHGHASLKNVHYQEGKFALGSILVALTAKDEEILDIQFLHLYLSQLKDAILVPLMSGAANVALSVSKIKTIKILFPSIDRQKEIVKKFKSIVSEEKELNSELTHQQTSLKKLRQQILQDAIEGKLTAEWRKQNSDIEPASELLKRIQAEKAKLVKEGKIKKQKHLPPISEKEKLFKLPDSWEWCRLGDVLLSSDSGKSPNCEKRPAGAGEWGVLTTTAIQQGYFNQNANKVLPVKYQINPSQQVEEGNILITRAGPLNRTGIACVVGLINKNLILSDKTIRLNYLKNLMSPEYVMMALNSRPIRDRLALKMTGMAESQVNISQENIKAVLFSLPPLPEQNAIVDKVENLFALCDQLETQITQNQLNAKQLIQAVLKEAFSGDA